MSIHTTAIIDSHAEIDATAEIGPYVVIDGPVHIGPETHVWPHAYLTGNTVIGAGCEIHPGAVVGHAPQDAAYQGEETFCRIGDGTIIREGASVHRGTDPGSTTTVGLRCLLMAGAHVGHNCHVGDDVVLVNGALLAGHVQVGRRAFFGGGAAVHQFTRIGEMAMIAGLSATQMDIPPCFTTDRTGKCYAVNAVGMKRAGLTREDRRDVKNAFRILYRSRETFSRALETLAESVETDVGRRILEFCRGASKRGISGCSTR